MNDTFEETLWEAAKNKALDIGTAWNLLDQAGNYVERLKRELNWAKARQMEADSEIERLKRGEFVCRKCGLRKNDEFDKGDF